jgi:FAD/FMN-containing dehydrogenase
MSVLLNDVHSMLNPVRVAQVVQPLSLADIQAAVRSARARGLKVSIAGGRHAMGGQQFAAGALHLDMRALDRVLAGDVQRGLLTIEAGADWPTIMAASHELGRAPSGREWGIRQKQTGVDAVTLGGSISANAHGRGLLLQPLGADIEALTLVNANGDVVQCSRLENPLLFSLVIGGFGLFGVIYSACLRLAPRQRLKRRVDIIDLDDALNAVFRRADEGCLYGDFQFVIDAEDSSFLKRGVLACYEPCGVGGFETEQIADLAPDTWLKLLKLAHDDKRMAFKLYSQHYLGTDGNHYWSDTHQLSTYLPGYAEFLASTRAPDAHAPAESLVIGEYYVPHAQILEFMRRARELLRETGTEVIYGTIRAIARDTESFMPWARQDCACVVFNLRTLHTIEGSARSARSFRGLSEAAIAVGGSFFLTYHRYASAAQVARAYPEFRQFLAKKLDFDPEQRFQSEWYRHYRDAFAALPEAPTARSAPAR